MHEMREKKRNRFHFYSSNERAPLHCRLALLWKWKNEKGEECEDGGDRRWMERTKMAPKIGFFITSNEMAKINGKSVLVCLAVRAMCVVRHVQIGITHRMHTVSSAKQHCYRSEWMNGKYRRKWTGKTHTKTIRAIRTKLKILNAIFSSHSVGELLFHCFRSCLQWNASTSLRAFFTAETSAYFGLHT